VTRPFSWRRLWLRLTKLPRVGGADVPGNRSGRGSRGLGRKRAAHRGHAGAPQWGEVFLVGAAKADDPPELRAALEKHVREAADELIATGVSAQGEVRRVADKSSAAAEIVAACHERAADLVALGSHGRANITALLEGGRCARGGAALLVLHVREMVPFGDVPCIEAPEEARQLMQELTAELPTI